MNFNLKYLMLPLSIITCINNNCINAMDDTDENQNEIIEHNNGNNTPQIQNQSNNDLLNVNINNENDEKKIKRLVTQSPEDIEIVKHLTGNEENNFAFDFPYKIYNHYYKEDLFDLNNEKAQILKLLKSCNNWNSNATFTVNQLETIYNIVKGVHFFLNNAEKIKRTDIEFAIDDNVFGIGLIIPPSFDYDFYHNCDKCIFIQPSNIGLFVIKNHDINKENMKQDLTNNSFKNFLDKVKLCSNKKLPIIFKDKSDKDVYKYLVTTDEYRDLLVVLLRDFWKTFYCEYEDNLLMQKLDYGFSVPSKKNIDIIKSDEDYRKLENEYENLKKETKGKNIEMLKQIGNALDYYDKKIILKKIKESFENNYDEKKFIEIFGEETINNIRYIINHLIDLEINSNYKLFEDTLNKILSKEQKLYETMRRPRNRGEKLIDKCVQELEKVFNLDKKVWKDNIILPQNENIFKQLGDKSKIELSDNNLNIDNDNKNYDDNVFLYEIVSKQYKLHSKERVEDYLKKLLYDKVLDTYLRTKVFKYIMSSNALIEDIHKNPSGTKEDRDLIKEKPIENINSYYELKNIFEYVKDSNRLKKGLFFGAKKNKNDKISNKINNNYNNNFEENEESNNKNNIILNKKIKRIFDIDNNKINNNYDSDSEESEESNNNNNDSSDDE